MKYQQPYGVSDANAAYIDGNPALGVEGSAVPAKAIEHPQREIVNVLVEAGLTPDENNLKQLALAIRMLIEKAMPPQQERYELCEFYYFRQPVLRPGFQPAQGGLLADAATRYPAAWAYLQTAEGQRLCKTESEWQSMTTATWATLADGSKIGWDGIGGAPYYAPNTATGALRLPDLRGMYAEAAGFDSLGVGGVRGDESRNVAGAIINTDADPLTSMSKCTATGALYYAGLKIYSSGGGPTSGDGAYTELHFETSRAAPTGPAFAPRRWGALACCYLGTPAS